MKLKELLDQMGRIASENKLSTPFIVGGASRDKFLGKLEEISDIDITTGDTSIEYLVKEMSIFLSRSYSFKLKKMPTGYHSLTLGNLKMDFSSNFLVPNIEAILRKMGIEKPTDMEKELYSRDFTCNTLLLAMDLKTISDETGRAIPDLKAKMIRTCLSPEITLLSNKNRVIRAIYLSSKLGFEIDESIVDWVRAHPDSVRFASEHTLREKLDKAMELDPKRTRHYIEKMELAEELRPYMKERA